MITRCYVYHYENKIVFEILNFFVSFSLVFYSKTTLLGPILT